MQCDSLAGSGGAAWSASRVTGLRCVVSALFCYTRLMPVVVGVHGIGQQYTGGYSLTSVWFDALRDGLAVAGYRSIADSLSTGDMRVAFFGDLFRPAGAMSGQDPPYTYRDIGAGVERDLLTDWYRAAVVADPALAPSPGSLAPTPVSAQVMLDRLLRFRGFAGVAERAFIGNLKQVSRFLTDAAVKERVLTRFGDELGPETKIVVGHSLGSVVAYEYLCRYQPSQVKLLVTMGSPLGIPTVVFDKLTPTPVNGIGSWPGTARRWMNVADRNDVVALGKKLAPLFAASPGGVRVDDQPVDNGWTAHAAERYLNSEPTGRAVGRCLG